MNKNYLKIKELTAVHTDVTNAPKIIKCKCQKLLDITGYETFVIELPDKTILTFEMEALKKFILGE